MRHRDLVAVGDVRGEVDRDEIRIARRATGFGQRILRARITGERVDARDADRTGDVDQQRRARRRRCVSMLSRRREFRRRVRRELRRPQNEGHDDGHERRARNRRQ